MDVRVGPWKRLSAEELKILSFDAGEDSWESLGQHEIKLVKNPKGNQPWFFTGRYNAETEAPILWSIWCEEPTHGKRPWCWERLRAGEEWDDRRWDVWMASSTRWTWVWVNSRNWWWTGRPGILQFMGSQIVGHNWATELNWIELKSWVISK